MSLGEDASGAFPEVILPTFAPPPPLMCYYDQAGVVERSGKLYFFIQSAGTLETETRTLLLNGAQANTWYQLSLHRGTGSASSPLTITVTKESDPSTTGTVTQTVSWVDWHFRHTIRSGTAYIDDYSERGETVEYAYGGQPHAVTSITSGGQTIRQYTYDLNGNMTQRIEGSDTYTFTYDTENRLMSGAKNGVTLASYTYDGDGKRVKAQEGGFTTYYIGDYYEWREGPTTTAVKYYYAAGQRIAMRQGGVLTWLLGDHLGSTTITANENGTLATEQTYTAWGQTRSGSVTTDRQYTGQISEPQLGIYFYNARYYDPYSARFLSADSIIPDPYNPVDWDRYAYVRNDPINGLDPSGNMRTESDGCFFAECGYTGPDYFPGGSTKQEKALKLINHLIEDQQEGGPQYSWTGLHEQHRKIFEEAGWNEAIYNDSVQPALSKADAAHDPAFYIVTAFTLGKLGAKVITAISSYFCLDSNCNNEIEWIDGVFPKTQAQISHIFRNAYGHLANDTAANRDLFLRAISPDNFIKVDQYGNQIFAQIIADGTEVWVIVRNGIIQNAGVNQIPQWIK